MVTSMSSQDIKDFLFSLAWYGHSAHHSQVCLDFLRQFEGVDWEVELDNCVVLLWRENPASGRAAIRNG